MTCQRMELPRELRKFEESCLGKKPNQIGGWINPSGQREPNPLDIPWNTDWWIGILLIAYLLQSPYNWVGCHPLYTANNQGELFTAHLIRHPQAPHRPLLQRRRGCFRCGLSFGYLNTFCLTGYDWSTRVCEKVNKTNKLVLQISCMAHLFRNCLVYLLDPSFSPANFQNMPWIWGICEDKKQHHTGTLDKMIGCHGSTLSCFLVEQIIAPSQSWRLSFATVEWLEKYTVHYSPNGWWTIVIFIPW